MSATILLLPFACIGAFFLGGLIERVTRRPRP